MRWLHISDIHYQNGDYDTARVRSRLIECMRRIGEFDFILVTGDVMYKHELDTECASFLNKLVRECGAASCKIYSCPGNHDVDRGNAKRNLAIENALNNNGPLSKEDVAAVSRHGYEDYSQFHKELTGREYDHFTVVKESTSTGDYRIISLDTNLLSRGDADSGSLRIMVPRLSDLADGIRDDSAINIAIMHHGEDFLEESERNRFQHWIDDAHIDIVFCGHIHHAAVKTYDETAFGMKQFAAGAAHYIEYCAPTVYVCDYDSARCNLSITPYAYYRGIEDWAEGTNLLRALRNGRCSSVIQRLYSKNADAVSGRSVSAVTIGSDCSLLFERLRSRYAETYGENIFSVRNGRPVRFSPDTVMKSVIDVGVPFSTALVIVNRGIENLVNDRAKHTKEMNTGILRDYIYCSICQTPKDASVQSATLKNWSSRYARRYRQNETRFTIIKGDEIIDFSFSVVKTLLIHQLLNEVTGVPKAEEILSSKEEDDMAEEIVSLIDSLDCQEISYEILYDLVKEIARRLPHPWFCLAEDRRKVLTYNLGKLSSHLDNIGNGEVFGNAYIEIIYHASAAILLCGGNFIGSKDLSPFRLLYEGTSRNKFGTRNDYAKSVAKKARIVADSINDELWYSVMLEIVDIEQMLKGDVDSSQFQSGSSLKQFGLHAKAIGEKYLLEIDDSVEDGERRASDGED